jgi:FAD/FMN-containing dehydrogenase
MQKGINKDHHVIVKIGCPSASLTYYGKVPTQKKGGVIGACDTIGIGGFVLAAGYGSWLSHQHGLAAGNLVGADIILGNGSLE